MLQVAGGLMREVGLVREPRDARRCQPANYRLLASRQDNYDVWAWYT